MLANSDDQVGKGQEAVRDRTRKQAGPSEAVKEARIDSYKEGTWKACKN